MNLRDTILKEHTSANCRRIVAWIGDNQQRFDELFRLFLSDEYRVVQRASWPLSYAAIAYPALLKKHFSKLIQNLSKRNQHDAAKRNTVRLLQDIELPEKHHGDVMNICFNYIASPDEKPAIKAFSLTILHNLSKQYPDILSELKTIIENRWEYESAAFKSRAKKVLKQP